MKRSRPRGLPVCASSECATTPSTSIPTAVRLRLVTHWACRVPDLHSRPCTVWRSAAANSRLLPCASASAKGSPWRWSASRTTDSTDSVLCRPSSVVQPLGGLSVPMSLGYIPFHPNPSRPKYTPPAGAVDARCHVFGPEARFPYAPERKYTPSDAPKEKLFALRDFLRLDKNVIVQASCHSKDNRAMVDALESSGGRAKGVAFVGEEVTQHELDWMDRAGVKGVRFNFIKRLVDFTPREVLARIAARVAPLGWHIVVYFEMADLPELEPFFTSLPTTVVVDHMGTPDVKKGVSHPENQRFHKLMETHPSFWVKVTCPERMSLAGPPYDDVVAFGRALVERFPDRVIWGTDWPHPNMKKEAPDDGMLVDYIPRIAPIAELQRKLLVDNPVRLYWS